MDLYRTFLISVQQDFNRADITGIIVQVISLWMKLFIFYVSENSYFDSLPGSGSVVTLWCDSEHFHAY
jgi:hypothetical protein